MSQQLNKISDADLIKMLRGDKKNAELSFAEIYSRYSNSIWAYCSKVLNNQSDINDAFQDVFTKFYNYIIKNKDKDINNINRFLITIARNTCLNYKRNKINFLQIDQIEHLIEGDNLKYQLIEKDESEILKKAIDSLPFEYKEIFVMRIYQGLSYNEIADITGYSIATVKNRIYRSKDKVKEYLTPYLNNN